ncbi:hypothetical protein Ddye_024012 [Dipteronia dyeriana]|uniref:Uncharacterized protein n=1 Tax=Dipteronia dyeriana TaxID=168575 RepID=A0AAD9TU15_9ROSI|nr:hypothetical protein Ddye_024012 [Dipteronia dyeriana]
MQAWSESQSLSYAVVNLSSSPTSVVILPYLSICHRHRRRHPSPVVVVPHLSSSSSSSSSLTCRRHRPSPVVVIVVLTCDRPSPANDDLSLAFYHSLTVTDRQRQIANDRSPVTLYHSPTLLRRRRRKSELLGWSSSVTCRQAVVSLTGY